jgi:17beta-estradiol 17-dehydrogenase / very-long-chain 3-oxoacyl-CoA reductase
VRARALLSPPQPPLTSLSHTHPKTTRTHPPSLPKGLNILLISRTESKLKAAASEIAAKFGVETDTLAIDFGATPPAVWAPRVAASVGPRDVGVLVNNVGLSYDHAEYYDALDDETIDALIAINVQATNYMTKAVLPGMKSRRRGAIVCIGSAAATVAPSGPLYAVYAGTKAYVDMFARSLDLECKAWGVSVQNQAPAYVATKMSKIRKPTLDAPSPAVWAASAARHIGYEPTSVPYWYHGLMWGAVSGLPLCVTNAYLLSFHEWLRARYYKKVEREARGGGAGGSSKKGR